MAILVFFRTPNTNALIERLVKDDDRYVVIGSEDAGDCPGNYIPDLAYHARKENQVLEIILEETVSISELWVMAYLMPYIQGDTCKIFLSKDDCVAELLSKDRIRHAQRRAIAAHSERYLRSRVPT